MNFERHPLSSAFPDMPNEEFAALVLDIKTNGLREAAWVSDGMILDGWHRYLACKKAGQPFRYDEYKGSNRVAFVLSKNTLRRHLTAAQRAQAVVACHAWLTKGRLPVADKSAPVADLPPESTDPDADVLPAAVSAKEMAKEANVGVRTIERAKAVQAAGLGGKVRDGELSAKRAAELASAKEGRAPKPKPVRVDPRDKRIAELEAEVEALKAELAQTREGMTDLRHDAETAAELMGTEPAQVLKKHKVEIGRLEQVRDDLLNEKGQLVRRVRSLESKLQRYEKIKKAKAA